MNSDVLVRAIDRAIRKRGSSIRRSKELASPDLGVLLKWPGTGRTFRQENRYGKPRDENRPWARPRPTPRGACNRGAKDADRARCGTAGANRDGLRADERARCCATRHRRALSTSAVPPRQRSVCRRAVESEAGQRSLARHDPALPRNDRCVRVAAPLEGTPRIDALHRYFRTQAGQEARKNIAAPFVLVLPDGAIAGYYTLSSTAIKLTELPPDVARKLPRYPLVPATLLGRLAVDIRYRGKGYGRFLLADALHRVVRSDIASFAIVVDAKDDAARRFYERESFLPLLDQPMKLYRPTADIAKLFA